MPASLRDALTSGPMIVAPGAYDGLTARMVARHGFPAVYMTGAEPRSRTAIPTTAF